MAIAGFDRYGRTKPVVTRGLVTAGYSLLKPLQPKLEAALGGPSLVVRTIDAICAWKQHLGEE
jgi:hypothetical protein